MIFELSSNFNSLPDYEVKRIQVYLKVILKNTRRKETLYKTITGVYRKLGYPSVNLLKENNNLEENIFLRLLSSFGIMSRSDMSYAEYQLVKDTPYIIWPDSHTCVVPTEAMNVFIEDPFFKKQKYLFALLKSLSPKEMRLWESWLINDLNSTNIIEPPQIKTTTSRTHHLYNTLARYRFLKSQHDDANVPSGCICREGFADKCPVHSEEEIYLDQIFTGDTSLNPIEWFMKGVYPLYHALHEFEQRAMEHATPLQVAVLNRMKSGNIVATESIPMFGQKSRYRLIATAESVPAITPEYIPCLSEGT